MLPRDLLQMIALKQDAQPRVQCIVLSDRRKMRHLMTQLARVGRILAPELTSATFYRLLIPAISTGKTLR